jgi:cytoplasmic tRNA 2-thiolation protein 1
MAEMEKKLLEDEAALTHETEISFTQLASLPSKAQRTNTASQPGREGGRTRRKPLKVQIMSQCSRCGYLTSQKICKACSLLEGLNKNRPKTAIEVVVDVDEEESSTTLMRQMEGIRLSNG